MKNIEAQTQAKVEFTIKFTLTKTEAQALEAIACYGSDNFLKIFYENIAKELFGGFDTEFYDLVSKRKPLKGSFKNPKDTEDSETFLKLFYEKMGKSYLQPHEKGLRSLFARIRSELPVEIDKIEKAEEKINEAIKDF